jgi:hypothetical protein
MPKLSDHYQKPVSVEKSQDDSRDEVAIREYAIQSMIEIKEKQLGRMPTPREIDEIARQLSLSIDTCAR